MPHKRNVELGIEGITDAIEIGQGGFAVVYHAFQPAFESSVAVKVFGDLKLDANTMADFRRECRAIGRLRGRPNIVTLYDAGITAKGKPYMIMAYMAGGSLEDRLAREGPLPWQEVVALGMKLGNALQVAHHLGVLHRDVKPANVLLSEDGEPQLADFGIARLTDVTRTTTSTLAFTPSHVAPEVLEGQPPTPLGDVYSLGSTLFALMAGRPAFLEQPDDNIFSVMSRVQAAPCPDLLRPRGVPEAVCRVIEAAMEKDPAKRPSSAALLVAALEEAVRPTRVTPGIPLPVGSRPRAIAITPNGATAYVANWGDATVTSLTLATGTTGAPIPVGKGPSAIAISPTGATGYVANGDDNTVTPINLARGTTGIPIPVGAGPSAIAISPNGATAYVANWNDNSVTPITLSSGVTGPPIRVGRGPSAIAITPSGATAYVTNYGDNTVTPITLPDGAARRPIPVGTKPAAIAINPDGMTAYAVNLGDDTVTPIALAAGVAGPPIPVGKNPIAIAMTGATAYVANYRDDTVTPIAVVTGQVGPAIAVGKNPIAIAIARRGRVAYVANNRDNTVTPVSLSGAG